jgi:NADH-quinone oxidoreductase subunit M
VTATVFAALSLLFTLIAWAAYDRASTDIVQFVEGKPYTAGALDAGFAWIPTFRIYYFVGADGLSLPLVLLTAILSLVAVTISFHIEHRVKEYFFFLLLLEAGMLGVFCALDFFLFYVFWEVMLVPMYFLIGIWGGPKKEFAAIKFFLYTLFGSVFMLVAILALYFTAEPHTFNLLELKQQAATGQFVRGFQTVVWLALFLGFAIKVPIFPFHTWLPLAHVEAPTAVSIILAGVLLKMGTYGLLRVNYAVLPVATRDWAWLLVVLGFINIVYGALCAMAQTDMKKLVAYSSINHMGYAILGMASLSAIGISGAIFQQLGHGFVTASLFLLVGVVYERAHHRDIDGFGGLGLQVPKYAGVMALACMASLGLPGLIGFVGEFLCFLGAFNPEPKLLADQTLFYRIFTALSVTGVLITAGFFLWMIQRVFLGKLNPKYADLPDMDRREIISVAPLCVLTVIGGVYPWFLLKVMNPASESIVAHIVNSVTDGGAKALSMLP